MFKLLLFASISLGTHGEVLESRYLQRLARAHSAEEAENLKDAYAQLRIVHTACHIELRERVVPSSCYEALSLEGQLDSQLDPTHTRRRLESLDILCADAATKLRLVPGVVALASALSAECAKRVAAATRIQNYRTQDAADWSEN